MERIRLVVHIDMYDDPQVETEAYGRVVEVLKMYAHDELNKLGLKMLGFDEAWMTVKE